MQIFIKIFTGLTLTYIPKNKNVLIKDIKKYICERYSYYDNVDFILYQDFGNELNVNLNENINENMKLCDLYKNNIVKEITIKTIKI
jgi:hypothetical protein